MASDPGQHSITSATWRRRFQCGSTTLDIELEADDLGLTRCRLLQPSPGADLESTAVTSDKAGEFLTEAVSQLAQYFAGARKEFTVPIHATGTSFQKEIWKATSEIPFGETQSYGWITARIARPGASRAAGNALGANPIPIFVPCHRVIRNNGERGGFTGGTHWKDLLLDLEKSRTNSLFFVTRESFTD